VSAIGVLRKTRHLSMTPELDLHWRLLSE
jgi:hypothetical protein